MSAPNPDGSPPRSTKRAARRHHRQRMIARARRSINFMGMTASERDRFALKQHDHLACCSCWMCGNPRRWFGEPTRRERLEATFRPLDPETDR